MTTNPDFLRCKEERKNEGFFKVLQSLDVSSEDTRALPHDFARSFSDKDLSRKMKIKAQWGSSWEVGISKNPRFYFMEKSGWEKFVRDNALGNNEFLTFTHKGKMRFTVNIFKQDGKEMIQPPQSAASLASSSRVKTEQREDVNKDEVVVSSELSDRGATAAAESSGRGTNRRKFNLGKKKTEETPKSKRAEKVVRVGRCFVGASSSSSVAEFTMLLKKSYVSMLRIPDAVAEGQMPDKKTMFKIHHSDGKKSRNVLYAVAGNYSLFSTGWRNVVEEYPIDVNDTCEFTFIKLDELRLVVSKVL